MTMLGAALAWVVLWLVGSSVLALADLRDDRSGAMGEVALDAVTGIVAIGALGTLCVTVGVPLSLVPFYLLAAGLAIAVVATRRWPRIRPHLPNDGFVVALLVVAAVLCVAILVGSARDRLWWDGWAIWTFKARVLFLEGGLPAALRDPGGPYAFTHVDYPLGVPLLDWWQYGHAGEPVPGMASFSGAVVFTLAPVLAWDGLSRTVDRRVAALTALGIAAFWPVTYYAAGGTADVFMAVALLGTVIEVARGGWSGDSASWWRAGLFLTLAALSKNEGLALGLVVVVMAIGVCLRRPPRVSPRRVAPVLLPLCLIAPWLVFRAVHGLGTDVIAGTHGPAEMLSRLGVLASATGSLLSSPVWIPVAAVTLLGAVAAVRRGTGDLRMAWAVLAGYLCVVAAVYARAPHDIAWLVRTSLVRVMGACVPAAVFLAVLAIWRSDPAVESPDEREAVRVVRT